MEQECSFTIYIFSWCLAKECTQKMIAMFDTAMYVENDRCVAWYACYCINDMVTDKRDNILTFHYIPCTGIMHTFLSWFGKGNCTHILQGYFTGTGAISWGLFQYKNRLFMHGYFHYRDKTVLYYNGNHILVRRYRYIDTLTNTTPTPTPLLFCFYSHIPMW